MKKSTPFDKPASPADSINFWEALLFWLKLGFISFGGPAGQIAIMHHELVEKRRWLSEKRFLHALNYCMLLPGPEAQQLAIYLGWLMHRTLGGIIAGSLFVLPSLLILIGLSWIYLNYGHIAVIASFLDGIKPAVTAIVVFAAYRMGLRVLNTPMAGLIALLSFLAITVLNAPFPLILTLAAFAGMIIHRYLPQQFAAPSAHASEKADHEPAIFDDTTPIPPHALFSWLTLAKVVFAGFLLWSSVMAFLWYAFGWDGTLTQMGWFFSKAALLTFGGAYAVLPYVYQGVVEHFHWLTPAQMIDGLALGETTPGPLIMVVSFVGFVAGWKQSLFGSEHQLLAGVAGAVTVVYFSFLPSFLFILAGGPLVESSKGNLALTAPLSAITAAVVGVIAHLATFFAWHVFWPERMDGHLNATALLTSLFALVALLRFKAGIISVILASGLLGVCLHYLKNWQS